MNDIDTMLRRDAARWNVDRPENNTDLDRLLDAAIVGCPRRSRIGSILAAAAAVLAVITVAAALALAGPGYPPAGHKAAVDIGPLTSTRLGPLVVRHPTNWHYLKPPNWLALTDSRPLGWLTNQTGKDQCAVINYGRSVMCHPPVARLTAGSVYLVASESGEPLAPPLSTDRSGFGFHPNTTVSGRPAELTEHSRMVVCPAGTTDRLSLIIGPERDSNVAQAGGIFLVACSSKPTPTESAAVRLALTTVHLSP